MELESKFIEGTNNRYSIRNDGVVISHYHIAKNGIPTFRDKNLSKDVKDTVRLYINPKLVKYTVSTLLKKYFSFYFCPQCNEKVFSVKKQRQLCDKCKSTNKKVTTLACLSNPVLKKRRLERQKKYRQKNQEKYRTLSNIFHYSYKNNLAPSYVASLMNISVHDMSDELYKAAKTRILIKRKLKQIQNGKKESHI